MEDLNAVNSKIEFINKVKKTLHTQEKSFASNLKEMKEAFLQYINAVEDITKARLEYVEIIEKYEEGLDSAEVLAPPSFLGINQNPATPTTYTDSEEDREALQELGATVKELESQTEFLEQRVLHFFQKASSDLTSVISTANQAFSYTDQLITDLDTVYGDSGMPGASSSEQ